MYNTSEHIMNVEEDDIIAELLPTQITAPLEQRKDDREIEELTKQLTLLLLEEYESLNIEYSQDGKVISEERENRVNTEEKKEEKPLDGKYIGHKGLKIGHKE
jgi:diphthamide synthase (EF-2-diphthine--ammonia ligase)